LQAERVEELRQCPCIMLPFPFGLRGFIGLRAQPIGHASVFEFG
jgi:hypothetical protein